MSIPVTPEMSLDCVLTRIVEEFVAGITRVGSPTPPVVGKVAVVLAEKDVPFEIDDLNPTSAPDGFRELSPLGKIPA